VPIELKPDHLKIEPDHVLADLLRAMHLIVNEVEEAFEPEGGAYSAATHAHSHAVTAAQTPAPAPHVHGPDCQHDHGHDHGHSHAAPAATAVPIQFHSQRPPKPTTT
jgi:urease accessory protein